MERSAPPTFGIILATHGTAVDQARQAYAAVEGRVRQAWPQAAVGWAFTSDMLRKRLQARGMVADSTEQALDRLHSQGLDLAVVQSLHTVPGLESMRALRATGQGQSPRGYRRVTWGGPLLATPEDVAPAAAALAGYIPSQRQPHEALVLLGHGTTAGGQAAYEGFLRHLAHTDPHIYFGAIDGRPDAQAVIALLRQHGMASAWLLPFLSVAGHHVRQDVASPDPESWRSQLEAAGIKTQVRTSGTIEHPPFVDLWLRHLEKAVAVLLA